MKFYFVLMAITFVCSACEKRIHNWQFKVKNECRVPDAFHLQTAFSPGSYKISVKGNLNESAMLYLNIYTGDSPSTSGNQIKLTSGKILYHGGGDMYEDKMTIIYVPDQVKKTQGELTINVEIK